MHEWNLGRSCVWFSKVKNKSSHSWQVVYMLVDKKQALARKLMLASQWLRLKIIIWLTIFFLCGQRTNRTVMKQKYNYVFCVFISKSLTVFHLQRGSACCCRTSNATWMGLAFCWLRSRQWKPFPRPHRVTLICIRQGTVLKMNHPSFLNMKRRRPDAEGFDAAQAGLLVQGDVIPLGLTPVWVCFLCQLLRPRGAASVRV